MGKTNGTVHTVPTGTRPDGQYRLVGPRTVLPVTTKYSTKLASTVVVVVVTDHVE